VLNLNGNSQTVGQWQTQRDNTEPRLIYSVAPATLTVSQSANTWFGGSITGALSIVKLGTGNLSLTNRFNTTSGGFTVSNGTLSVTHLGTLGPNSTNIVVGGTGTAAPFQLGRDRHSARVHDAVVRHQLCQDQPRAGRRRNGRLACSTATL
jgi:autotransporter-associated beta strand protein